jgi:RNA polymerase sigma factor (sigma-70 family)
MDAADSPTGVTLFNVIDHRDNPQVWQRFVLRYGPLIATWCRGWRLQEADVHDVVQEVLIRLYRHIGAFQRQQDGSFRAYLKKVTHSVLWNHDQARRRPGQGSGDSEVQKLLEDLTATEQLTEKLDREFDREILEEATARVQCRVEAHTWEAFRLSALEGMPGKDVAERLGMKRATVFVAKSKVTKMLKEEIAKLEQSGTTGGSEP